MSDLLWVRRDGRLISKVNGFELIVASNTGGGYMFQLVCSATSSGPKACLGSGQRDDLNEAIEAAERAARRFAAQRHSSPRS